MSEQCSEIFEEVFEVHCGTNKKTCCCGIVHFDGYNSGISWEPGELEALRQKAKSDPNYDEHDGSIGWMEIAGREIVFGCSCEMAANWEKFIRTHAVQLKNYLNKLAEAYRAKADEITVK